MTVRSVPTTPLRLAVSYARESQKCRACRVGGGWPAARLGVQHHLVRAPDQCIPVLGQGARGRPALQLQPHLGCRAKGLGWSAAGHTHPCLSGNLEAGAAVDCRFGTCHWEQNASLPQMPAPHLCPRAGRWPAGAGREGRLSASFDLRHKPSAPGIEGALPPHLCRAGSCCRGRKVQVEGKLLGWGLLLGGGHGGAVRSPRAGGGHRLVPPNCQCPLPSLFHRSKAKQPHQVSLQGRVTSACTT